MDRIFYKKQIEPIENIEWTEFFVVKKNAKSNTSNGQNFFFLKKKGSISPCFLPKIPPPPPRNKIWGNLRCFRLVNFLKKNLSIRCFRFFLKK